jgi:hypothetical protein
MRCSSLATGLALAVAAALAGPGAAAASGSCDRVASPSGSDSAPGTVAAPFRTVQRVIDGLAAGEEGCLRAGLYASQTSLTIDKPSIKLTSYQGESATVRGRLWITNKGNGVTVEGLSLDGRPGVTSPTINGDNVVFRGNDVTNLNTAICFHLGNPEYGRAENTLIEGNNIHHCGVLPATNQEHGIYVNTATNTMIKGNWIHHNADFAVHLYPDADQTTVIGNVIDSNGEGIIFSGEDIASGYVVSDHNLVRNNIITNSQIRQNVESYYPPNRPVGTGNVVTDNCIKGAPGWYAEDGSGVQSPQNGFTAVDTLIADPGYANPAAGNYSIPQSSPCAAVLAGAEVSGGVTPTSGDPAADDPPAASGGKKKKKKKKRRRKARR